MNTIKNCLLFLILLLGIQTQLCAAESFLTAQELIVNDRMFVASSSVSNLDFKGAGLFLKPSEAPVSPNLNNWPSAQLDFIVGSKNNCVSEKWAKLVGFSESPDYYTFGAIPNVFEVTDQTDLLPNFDIRACFKANNKSGKFLSINRKDAFDVGSNLHSLMMFSDYGATGINHHGENAVDNNPISTLEVWGLVEANTVSGKNSQSNKVKLMLLYDGFEDKFMNNAGNPPVNSYVGLQIINNVGATYGKGIEFSFHQNSGTAVNASTTSNYIQFHGWDNPSSLNNTTAPCIGCINICSGCNLNFTGDPYPHKSFIIDHPLDPENKYLIHALLEGPDASVYYRGKITLSKGKGTVKLPQYFESLTREDGRTIQLTNPYGRSRIAVQTMDGKQIKNGKFTVISENKLSSDEIFWEVTAIRNDVAKNVPEPLKSEVDLKGFGPYKFVVPK